MKTLLLSLLFATAALAADKAPEFPSEIKLTNGATLRNTRAERFAADYVVVRHAGGIDRVRYVNIAEPARAQVLTAKNAAPAAAAAIAGAEQLVIEGDAFAPGAEQPYIFAGMLIALYPKAEALHSLNNISLGTAPTMPKAIATIRTDPKGHYRIFAPAGDWLLYASATRGYRTGAGALYSWKIELTSEHEQWIDLNGSNAQVGDSRGNAVIGSK